MVPGSVDVALLREHSFQETKDINVVLDSRTFTDKGGFKPISKYGLGYFNYDLSSDSGVYSRSISDVIRGHVYEYFMFYFVFMIFLSILWVAFFWVEFNSTNKLFKNYVKKEKHNNIDDDDVEYHHIKFEKV